MDRLHRDLRHGDNDSWSFGTLRGVWCWLVSMANS